MPDRSPTRSWFSTALYCSSSTNFELVLPKEASFDHQSTIQFSEIDSHPTTVGAAFYASERPVSTTNLRGRCFFVLLPLQTRLISGKRFLLPSDRRVNNFFSPFEDFRPRPTCAPTNFALGAGSVFDPLVAVGGAEASPTRLRRQQLSFLPLPSRLAACCPSKRGGFYTGWPTGSREKNKGSADAAEVPLQQGLLVRWIFRSGRASCGGGCRRGPLRPWFSAVMERTRSLSSLRCTGIA